MEKTIRTKITKAAHASLQGMEILLMSLRAVSPTMLLALKKGEGG